MRLAADYCATISDETLAMVYPLERICVHLIRRLDVERDAARGRLPALRLQAVDRPGRARRPGLLDGEVPRHARGPRGHGRHRDGLPPAAVQPAEPPQPGHRRAGRGQPAAPRGRGGQPARPARPAERPVAAGVAAQPGRRRPGVRTGWTTGRWTGDRLHYRTVVDLSRARRGARPQVPVWDLRLEITKDDETNVTPFSIDPAMVSGSADPGPRPARRRWRRATSSRS